MESVAVSIFTLGTSNEPRFSAQSPPGFNPKFTTANCLTTTCSQVCITFTPSAMDVKPQPSHCLTFGVPGMLGLATNYLRPHHT